MPSFLCLHFLQVDLTLLKGLLPLLCRNAQRSCIAAGFLVASLKSVLVQQIEVHLGSQKDSRRGP